MSDELLDAAREYSVASDHYQAACLRIAMARGVPSVPAAEWDEATLAACRAVNAAQEKLTGVCERLFPQTVRAEAWNEYYTQFYGANPFAPPAKEE